ncbi:type VI secretion system tip protein VgrG [Entomomonas moraniae]|uniref:Type VI secretion system tip protein VgrG n=1 Tax=Entomomonas moraniae TaxID=2213226 RepID=A0A3Q9JN12_9GAMM|nr:type VI secretion system Vgr family protein [Entomomonas moraniae]AZS50191.1 type VI secretion system tip protein VgrG [Entomomonas moraniae]
MFEITNNTSFFLEVEDASSARLQVLSFDGIESLNTEYAIEVTLVSDHLRFDVSSLLSKKAFLAFNGSKTSGIHGIVYAVRRGTISEHYAEYKILLMPRFTHLRKRTNHRTFINKTVPQIIKTLLEEQGLLENAQFVFKFKEAAVYTPREFCCQYGESDADFIHRLCEECGIAIHYEFSQTEHLMVFSDAIPFFPKLTPAYLYRPDAGMTTDQMVFKRFDVELLTNASVAAERNYNFKNKKHPESAAVRATLTKANQANEPQLEHYQYPSLGNTQTQTNYQTKLTIERLNANRILAEASSNINTLHSGYYVSIEDYPLVDGLNANEPWLIQQIHHQGRQPQVLEAFASTHSAESYLTPSLLQKHFKHPIQEELQFTSNSFQQGYRNCLVATPQQIIYRPQYLHLKPRVLGTQTALVTGPQNEEIYCDEYGRVKIQFHWDRLGQYNEHSSHWIRVANNWAHHKYGAIEIPRIGMEVVVDFIEGDIDNPIIRGAVHNGISQVPYDLPRIKTQSTLKSKEYKGEGYNEVLLDDTTGQVKTQIHSTPGTSQLNLGVLTHPRNLPNTKKNGEARGLGFELRTDEWGAVRAGKGLYVSTDERNKASSQQLDMQEAIDQLKRALQLAEELAKSSQQANALKTDTANQKYQLDTVYTQLTKPGMLTSAAEGFAFTTPKAAQISAQGNITLTAGENTDLSTAQNFRVAAAQGISLYSVNQDMQLIANKGQVKVQAQANQMELVADKTLKIVSTEDQVIVSADKELLLTSGGAYIKIKDGNIYLHAPGVIENKALAYPHAEPANIGMDMPEFVSASSPSSQFFRPRRPICIECLKTAAEYSAMTLEVS